MPITDGQLFISNAGEALDPTHLVEIQRFEDPAWPPAPAAT